MSFFRNFPIIGYNFGNEVDQSLMQNITAYIDLIDQVADDASFYENYTIIDGERPDTLSHKLYGTTSFYWTFYLLNEKIRLQGWPLTIQDMYNAIDQYYPNTTLITDESIHGEFYIGDTVATEPFTNPPFKGKIIEKNLDLGQVIVSPFRDVVSVKLLDSGTGYTEAPTVTLSGGGGKGAILQAVNNDSDRLDAIAVIDGGDGYTSSPTITISPPDIPRGDQARAEVTIGAPLISRGTVVYTQKDVPDPAQWDPEELRQLTTFKVSEQKNSVHHYEDSAGTFIDLDIPDD